MAERTTAEWFEAVKSDPALAEYAQVLAEDCPGGLPAPQNVLYDCTCDLQRVKPGQVLPEAAAGFVRTALEQLSQAGHADAMCDLGALYYTGQLGRVDYDKAREWYERSDAAGCIQAAENLGYIWYYGRCGKVDYGRAFRCFLRGARHKPAQPACLYKLGDMYLAGRGVIPDAAMARDLFEEAYDLVTRDEGWAGVIGGDVSLRMGRVYDEGIDADIDLNEALSFYLQAESLFRLQVDGGDSYAQEGLDKTRKRIASIRMRLGQS